MKPTEFLRSWLLLLIFGVCHSIEEQDHDYSDVMFRRQGKLSPHRYENIYPLDFSGEYLSDQPADVQTDNYLEVPLNLTGYPLKNSSSRTKSGRKKGRRSTQSMVNQSASTRRKQGKHVRLQTKGRFRIKSKDLDFLPGFGRIAQRSCPTKYNWLTLERAINIDNNRVDVYQPYVHTLDGLENFSQTFFVESCLNDVGHRDCPDCCKGIDHSIYSSTCKQRMSYVQALVALPGTVEFFWSHIKVNSSCVCEFALDQP